MRNVRAAGGDAVLRHGRRERVRLEQVAAEDRAPVLKAYLARAHVPGREEAPLEEFERVSSRAPGLRILPREG